MFLKLFKKRDNGCVDFVLVASKEAIKFYLWSDYHFYGGGKGSGLTVNLVICKNLYICEIFFDQYGWIMYYCVDGKEDNFLQCLVREG